MVELPLCKRGGATCSAFPLPSFYLHRDRAIIGRFRGSGLVARELNVDESRPGADVTTMLVR